MAVLNNKYPHLKWWIRTCSMIICTDPLMLSSYSYLSNNTVKQRTNAIRCDLIWLRNMRYIIVKIILNSINLFWISRTLPLMKMNDMTSFPQLTQEGHADNAHQETVLRSSGSTHSLKSHNHQCHSKHPPMSRSCKQVPHPENNLREHYGIWPLFFFFIQVLPYP